MIYDLAEVAAKYDSLSGSEITVRCRVQSDPRSGPAHGQKTLYVIDDPTGSMPHEGLLSFWTSEPDIPNVTRTEPYVISAIGETEPGAPPATLRRGETVLVRGIPNLLTSDGQSKLYINVTTAVIRAPDIRIGKSEMRVREQCSREYYLSFVKKVYSGRKRLNGAMLRGQIVHKAIEKGLDEQLDRFRDDGWGASNTRQFVDQIVDEQFSLELAKLVAAGIGKSPVEDAKSLTETLFQDAEFQRRLTAASNPQTERELPVAYGYRGDVDLVLDGVPYELKTTHNPSPKIREKHEFQLKLYLLVLLLERLDRGDSLADELANSVEGYLLYPNTDNDEGVRFVRVTLQEDDISTLMRFRNAVADARTTFGVPSPYNKDCDGCRHRTETKLGDATLPSPCKYHCQTERRWSCYNIEQNGAVTSDCSLFAECEQRFEFIDSEKNDHYNRLRKALRTEHEARTTAGNLIERLDESTLTRSGRLITGASLSGAQSPSVAIFGWTEDTIPAFVPGDELTVIPETPGETAEYATYRGHGDGELYLEFAPKIPTRFIRDDVSFSISYRFNADTVSRKYLPYLDYAQRRDTNPRFNHDAAATSTTQQPDVLTDTADISSSLTANTELFVDVPVRADRHTVVEELIYELLTAQYFDLEDEPVTSAGRRTLVLTGNPQQLAAVEDTTPAGNHYRLDGRTGGEKTIDPTDSFHEIQTQLLNSRSLLSTIQYALESETFHTLREGGFGNRDHSDRFFDVLVLLGAEQLTEPEYLFVNDLADRVVSIGDRRHGGPTMLSPAARNEGLAESYFAWGHSRYQSVPASEATSLSFGGHGNTFLEELYPDTTWEPHETSFTFLPVSGTDATDLDTLELHASVRAESGDAHQFVFDTTHTTANPYEVQASFIERTQLDDEAFVQGEVYLIDDHSLHLVEKERLADEETASHKIIIQAEAEEVSALTESFLYNRQEAGVVASVVAESNPDVVVTPFAAQANAIQSQLVDRGLEVPVMLADQLNGTRYDSAIVSFAVANDINVLRPPLTEPGTLYQLLSCADDIVLVGDRETVGSKDLLKRLLEEEAAEYVSPM
ncbi:PD-(D/E)XK nuclease family protein [Salinigranum halophilum]|uniref:PD-(D/E)XK nuclease family protein n=1 Tax=Salinigranum halophilum TaxID=2565931 RepID=UPI00115ECB20|nr:PD-(D/E)XK nuclease family protein [Salinigranum halophilum]